MSGSICDGRSTILFLSIFLYVICLETEASFQKIIREEIEEHKEKHKWNCHGENKERARTAVTNKNKITPVKEMMR